MEWLGAPFDFAAGAILNILKPAGKSSFYVVKRVRFLTNTKVGHAGTLDPFATGVLLLCTGKATKKSSQLMELPKWYVGEIELGKTTNTDDVTGEITGQYNVPKFSLSDVETVCQKFIGEIDQIPPMFSAKKVNGRRLYKLARKGLEIERKPHRVHIYDIKIHKFSSPIVKIEVNCSKGTYIRALARDIGAALGCGGFLKSLTRIRVGHFGVEDSLRLEDLPGLLLQDEK
ncbi:MAG: tRNA pseudouridine(55) synthase TruB [Calditrichaeota bacterium]|nr:tRNA pseudouridine(55) synthase TruB [Calditrichota bacterium]